MQFAAMAPELGGHGVAVKYSRAEPSGMRSGAGLPARADVQEPVKLMKTPELLLKRAQGPSVESDVWGIQGPKGLEPGEIRS